jgi:hypothetical protein
MVEMLVIVWLSFMDGSVVQYKNDDASIPIVVAQNGNEALKKCQEKIDEILIEMRKDFKDHETKPSTFMLGCTQRE